MKENCIKNIKKDPHLFNALFNELSNHDKHDEIFIIECINSFDELPEDVNESQPFIIFIKNLFFSYKNKIPDTILLHAIKKCGKMIIYGTDEFRDNLEYATIAINQNWSAFPLISQRLRGNQDLISLAVLKNEERSKYIYSFAYKADLNITEPYLYYNALKLKNTLEKKLPHHLSKEPNKLKI